MAEVLRPHRAVEGELVRQSSGGGSELRRPRGEPGGAANAAALGLRAHAGRFRGQLEETQEQGGVPRKQSGLERGVEQGRKEAGQEMSCYSSIPLYSACCM